MTAQAAEVLFLEGRAERLVALPLAPWLDAHAIDLRNRDCYSTALYRGYQGLWELHDGQLYLIGLADACDNPIDASRLFPGRSWPVPAFWFSGNSVNGTAEFAAAMNGRPPGKRRTRELECVVCTDHIPEVGGAQTLAQSIHACRIGGHISMIGVLTGIEAPVSTATLMSKNIKLKGITVGSCRHQLDMIRAIEANGIVPVIDSHFPLERIADAFRHEESGRHFGKIVLDI